MELNLSGKHIVVTASSKGLGRACAEALLGEGAEVYISSRNDEHLKQAAQEIKDTTGRQVATIQADLSKSEGVDSLFEQLKRYTTHIDGLICNAGGPPAGSFNSFKDDSQWYSAFETNLLSVVRLVRHALPLMEAQGGRIVTIASSSVKVPIPGLILSNTMRAGVQGLMKSLSIELGPKGILLNTVCPGRIKTDRLQQLDELKAQSLDRTLEDVQAESQQEIPLGRYGQPHEFASLVTYLISPANTYLTGSTYMVDGGMVKAL
jgi:3-oxoacyl-[acyl-carrier protein] reductase